MPARFNSELKAPQTKTGARLQENTTAQLPNFKLAGKNVICQDSQNAKAGSPTFFDTAEAHPPLVHRVHVFPLVSLQTHP